MARNVTLTGVERLFDEDEFIVSKTDLKGKIVYANRLFIDLAEFTEKELLGQSHNIVRHPEMPRCVFKLLWERVQSGKEIFAYVVNRTKNGNHYWVFAHVTPSFDLNGNINGYHSNRRAPSRKTLNETIIPLYKKLLQEEAHHSSVKDGMESSYQMLHNILQEKGLEYDQFILSI